MLRYLNGFDFYPTGNGQVNAVADGFFGSNPNAMTGVSPGRFSKGKTIQSNSVIFFSSNFYDPVGQRFTTEECVIGMAIYIPKSVAGLPGYHYGFGVYDGEGGVGNQILFKFEETGIIRLYRGGPQGTLLATTAAGTFNLDEWFWFEVKVKIHNSSGLAECRVNTVTKISFVGDTHSGTPLLGAAYGWDNLHWYQDADNVTTRVFNWDDVYVLDDTGTDNTDYLGNVRVNTQFTVGAGDLTQFSRVGSAGSNWDTVNETALDDTQYVYDGTVGQKDLYAMDPNVAALNIFGVQVRGAYRQDDSTQIVARNIIKTGGTIYEGSNDHYLSGTYKYFRDIWELNPNTGVGWVSADLNAIQAGTKVQAIG